MVKKQRSIINNLFKVHSPFPSNHIYRLFGVFLEIFRFRASTKGLLKTLTLNNHMFIPTCTTELLKKWNFPITASLYFCKKPNLYPTNPACKKCLKKLIPHIKLQVKRRYSVLWDCPNHRRTLWNLRVLPQQTSTCVTSPRRNWQTIPFKFREKLDVFQHSRAQ